MPQLLPLPLPLIRCLNTQVTHACAASLSAKLSTPALSINECRRVHPKLHEMHSHHTHMHTPSQITQVYCISV